MSSIREPSWGKIGSDGRSLEQLREHYEVEKKLAEELRNAPREARLQMYRTVYNRLFDLIPDHPQIVRKSNPSAQQKHVANQMKILAHFLKPDSTFMELGAGDCSLAFEIAKLAREVYAVEVSDTISKMAEVPSNFKLVLFDGVNIPLPSGSVNVAYSNQVVEHLHPDDALEQTKSIHDILGDRGIYICITPNHLNGPHDISRFFDENAKGLHLKEYSNRELGQLLMDAGFQKVRSLYLIRGRIFLFPLYFVKLVESLLSFLPEPMLKKMAHWHLLKFLLGIKLVARKK